MKFVLALGVLALVCIAPLANATDTPEPKKVIVCKYVGTPGVDEVLQTGDNPIQVSENAIPGFTGTFPYEFADAQGRSLAIRFAVDVSDQGTLSECPGVTPPPPVDVCPNIPGDQAEVPPGFELVEGECRLIVITPFCAPPLVLDPETGLCVAPPPCTVNCGPTPPTCPPGMVPTNGLDGEPGNDVCEFPPNTPPTTVTPPTTTTTPPSAPICPKPPAPTVVTKIKTVVKWKTKVVYKTKIVVKWRTRTLYKTKCPPGYRMSERFGCTGTVQGSG